MVKKPLKIKTDSKYSIDCMNPPHCEQSQSSLTIDFHVGFQKWLPKWQQNGFKTATGGPVKNVGIIRYLSAHLDARASYGQQIFLHYVKGHNGEEGNEGADAQANKGTMLPAVPERDWEKLESKLRKQEGKKPIHPSRQATIVSEMRQRNAKFARDARQGKKAARPSRQEQLSKRSPLNFWALGVIVFVVCGGVILLVLLSHLAHTHALYTLGAMHNTT
jgi:ribonuclease HI